MRDRGKQGRMYLVVNAGWLHVRKQSYNKAFVARIRVARESAGLKRPDIAKALGVKTDTYAQYEAHVMMPHHLIPAFCKLTGVSISYLFDGPDQAEKPKLKSV